jgi:D-alanyl-D-alanine carboxypeptidase
MKKLTISIAAFFCMVVFISCSIQKQIAREARQDILKNVDFIPAHVGISLFDASTQQYIFNYQGDKYFVPASNTKLFTCYAAMKNLGDSLVGLRYVNRGDGAIEAEANGDPSFLMADFKRHPVFDFLKKLGSNTFFVRSSANAFLAATIPFYTADNQIAIDLLRDTLKTQIEQVHTKIGHSPDVVKIYSQPTDSLLRIMMHRSDNFFAEQILLMISNEKLDMMNDSRIIDTLLKTDFANLPQKPKWVDGSGLSRYNLISPQDFVWVLTQMKKEFKWERIQAILPTGGEGTLSGAYKNYAGRIYAKTGTLSNHVALSGYILTKKGKQLIFSVLVNAHLTSAANIRKGVERFLTWVMDKY